VTLAPAPAGTAVDPKSQQGSGLRPADLVGQYTIARGEREGVPEPEERVKGSVVRFSEDRVIVVDKENKEIYGAEYKLDARHNPAQITMTSKLGAKEGEVARGLIDKNGETVRLIYALPGGAMPTSFKTRDKQLMFEMKLQQK
jgi:uncharacterized protein (TIGR03067 family)